jgi:hypothetical protein
MRVNVLSGNAQVFQHGKWSKWMPRHEAERIEREMYYGSRPYRGIYLLADAQAAGVAPSRPCTTAKGRGVPQGRGQAK